MLQSLIEQKKEYIEQLQNLLAVPLAERIYSIYIDCQKKGLKQFQYELNQISKWNNHIIQEEAKKIVSKTKCNYLAKLLKVTIIVSIKIKFYEYKNKLRNLDISVPNLQDFIHKCFINVSEFAWKNSYLFVQHNLKTVEIQNNLNIIEYNFRKMVAKSISECINVQEIIELLDEVMESSLRKNKNKKTKQVTATKEINSISDDNEDVSLHNSKTNSDIQSDSDSVSDSRSESDEEPEAELDSESDDEPDVKYDLESEIEAEADGVGEPDRQPDQVSMIGDSDTQLDTKSDYDDTNLGTEELNNNSICDSDEEVKPQFSESSGDPSSDSDDDNDRYSMHSSDEKDSDIKVVNIVEVEKKPIKKTKRPSFF